MRRASTRHRLLEIAAPWWKCRVWVLATRLDAPEERKKGCVGREQFFLGVCARFGDGWRGIGGGSNLAGLGDGGGGGKLCVVQVQGRGGRTQNSRVAAVGERGRREPGPLTEGTLDYASLSAQMLVPLSSGLHDSDRGIAGKESPKFNTTAGAAPTSDKIGYSHSQQSVAVTDLFVLTASCDLGEQHTSSRVDWEDI